MFGNFLCYNKTRAWSIILIELTNYFPQLSYSITTCKQLPMTRNLLQRKPNWKKTTKVLWRRLSRKVSDGCPSLPHIPGLSETYRDSISPTDDYKLQISRYTLIHSDHPCNTKHGGVCIFYRSYFSLRVINIGYLHECLTFELQIVVAHYRSVS